jgi:hypothetical protein
VSGCTSCGTRYVQTAPFRVLKEPRWGKRSIQGIELVYDELSVKPEAWEKLFQPLGIEGWPVVAHKTGAVLDNIVQLKIDRTVDVLLDNHPSHICPKCNQQYYDLPYFDFMPFPKETQWDVFKSEQWFSTGAAGRRLVYFSKRIYERILDLELRGGVFYPCAPDN